MPALHSRTWASSNFFIFLFTVSLSYHCDGRIHLAPGCDHPGRRERALVQISVALGAFAFPSPSSSSLEALITLLASPLRCISSFSPVQVKAKGAQDLCGILEEMDMYLGWIFEKFMNFRVFSNTSWLVLHFCNCE